MTKSNVVADFCGKVITEDTNQIKPIKSRVLLNREQLVLATGERKEVILLSNITNTKPEVGIEHFSQFFEEAIAITYRQNETQKRAVIGGSADAIVKFRTRLYKLLICEPTVLAKHPAKRGGRITNVSAIEMTLKIDQEAISLIKDNQAVKIHINTVVGVERDKRQLRSKQRPTLVINHAINGTTHATYISSQREQKLTFLSHFITQNYSLVVADLNDIELSETEIQLLVLLHTLDMKAKRDRLMIMVDDIDNPDAVVEQLRQKQLVSNHQDELQLTYRGAIVVTEQVQSVNK